MTWPTAALAIVAVLCLTVVVLVAIIAERRRNASVREFREQYRPHTPTWHSRTGWLPSPTAEEERATAELLSDISRSPNPKPVEEDTP